MSLLNIEDHKDYLNSFKKDLNILNDMEEGKETYDLSLKKLQEILDQEVAIIPLFYIPSIFYSRLDSSYNPLTEVFQTMTKEKK